MLAILCSAFRSSESIWSAPHLAADATIGASQKPMRDSSSIRNAVAISAGVALRCTYLYQSHNQPRFRKKRTAKTTIITTAAISTQFVSVTLASYFNPRDSRSSLRSYEKLAAGPPRASPRGSLSFSEPGLDGDLASCPIDWLGAVLYRLLYASWPCSQSRTGAKTWLPVWISNCTTTESSHPV